MPLEKGQVKLRRSTTGARGSGSRDGIVDPERSTGNLSWEAIPLQSNTLRLVCDRQRELRTER
jgi:hypothetical protein